MSDTDHGPGVQPGSPSPRKRATFLASTRSKVIAIVTALVLVLALGGLALAQDAKQTREEETAAAHEAEKQQQIDELLQASAELVAQAGNAKTIAADADGHLSKNDQLLLDDLGALIAAAGPLQYTSDYADLGEIVELTGQLQETSGEVEAAVRDFDNTALDEAIKSASKLLDDSKGKVADDKVRGKLSAAISEAKQVGSDGELKQIREATKSVTDAAAKVKSSQEDYAKAEKAKKEKKAQESRAASQTQQNSGASTGTSPKSPATNQSNAAPSKPAGSSSSSKSSSNSKPAPKPKPKPKPAPEPAPKPKPKPQPSGLSAGAAQSAIAGLSNGSSGCSVLSSYYADTAESLRFWANSFKSSNSPIPVKFTYIGAGSNGTQGINGMLCDS